MMILFKIKKKVQLYFFNKRNKTNVNSIFASLKSNYGFKVRISENSIIEDNVKIGNFSYVNSNSYIENCEIGKFC